MNKIQEENNMEVQTNEPSSSAAKRDLNGKMTNRCNVCSNSFDSYFCENEFCGIQKIITICGSTRFKIEFEFMVQHLISTGWFVHSVEVYDVPRVLTLPEGYKKWLEELHFWKIKRSNAIYVIDPKNYIGESTKIEVEFAKKLEIPIYHYSKGDLL